MMRNLKDLAHRIASGEEVGNLNLAQSLELLVRVLVGNDAELGIRISTASFCLTFGQVLHRAYQFVWSVKGDDFIIPLQRRMIWSFM